MTLLRSLLGRTDATTLEERTTLEEWYQQVQYAGNNYLLTGNFGGSGTSESIPGNFAGMVAGAYQGNGIVFAAMLARLSIFSEARFMLQRLRNGRPGDLFSSPALGILERPWPNGTTGELLARMIQDADCAGNFYGVRTAGPRLRRLRPDWVDIILSADPATTAEVDVLGYIYRPGGRGSTADPVAYSVEQVVHWSPHPDPLATYRGMSWLTPVLREIQADQLATRHKLKFFENGATLQSIIRLDKAVTKEQFVEFSKLFAAAHEGVDNAYRNLVVGGGADVSLVGRDLQQLDFKVTQGAGETRIAAASGIHPVILGLSEGLAGSSLNQGNFSAARRLTADKTIRTLWRSASAALASVIAVPADARLWTDDRDVAFLREDRKDLAEIQAAEAETIRALCDGGWEPESVKSAVANQDWSLLKHTGLLSVQLQVPGAQTPAPTPKGD